MTQTQQFWTPVVVDRGIYTFGRGYGFHGESKPFYLAVLASFDQYRDTFTVAIDGHSRTWYRRGAPFFKTRRECVNYCVAKQTFPMG